MVDNGFRTKTERGRLDKALGIYRDAMRGFIGDELKAPGLDQQGRDWFERKVLGGTLADDEKLAAAYRLARAYYRRKDQAGEGWPAEVLEPEHFVRLVSLRPELQDLKNLQVQDLRLQTDRRAMDLIKDADVWFREEKSAELDQEEAGKRVGLLYVLLREVDPPAADQLSDLLSPNLLGLVRSDRVEDVVEDVGESVKEVVIEELEDTKTQIREEVGRLERQGEQDEENRRRDQAATEESIAAASKQVVADVLEGVRQQNEQAVAEMLEGVRQQNAQAEKNIKRDSVEQLGQIHARLDLQDHEQRRRKPVNGGAPRRQPARQRPVRQPAPRRSAPPPPPVETRSQQGGEWLIPGLLSRLAIGGGVAALILVGILAGLWQGGAFDSGGDNPAVPVRRADVVIINSQSSGNTVGQADCEPLCDSARRYTDADANPVRIGYGDDE